MPAITRLASASPELEEVPGKRKRDEAASGEAHGDDEAGVSKRQAKRRKQKDKSRAKRAVFAADEELDEVAGVNTSLGRLDPQLTADYIARQSRRFNPDLTAVELEELRVPGKVRRGVRRGHGG